MQASNGGQGIATINRNSEPLRIGEYEVSRTGQFLHVSGHRKDVFFATKGDVSRSFTILLTLAKNEDGVNFNKNGIAIIDNDNMSVLLEGIHGQPSGAAGPSSRQLKNFESICHKDWREMSKFIRSQDYYSGVALDIDAGTADPMEGNFDSQVTLGLKRVQDRDFRDDFIRELHRAGDYNLPAISRTGMISQLLMHPKVKDRGVDRLSWSIKLNPEWDLSGHLVKGEDLDRKYDGRWKRELRSNEKVMAEVQAAAYAGFLSSGFSVCEMEGAACALSFGGRDDESIVMREWNGVDMGFNSVQELKAKLMDLSDDGLKKIWSSVRILDQDLARTERLRLVQEACNGVRAHVEENWVMESELEDRQELGFS